MATPPLERIGKYQIVDILGEGAMGVVYRAYDQVLNRYLAIKVMNTAIGNSAQLRERFLREARAAGSLQHPNVVTIYDFGEADDHLFIAMEFVDGEDLAEVIRRRQNIPITTKLDVMVDMLNGLSYAHGRGVVHRDIKPANIRVTSDTRAKLMDFGIAHLQQSELTQSGVLIGTPQYMAPEQVSGGAITAATDVFAAGCVLYEFLAYRRPFEGDTLHVIMYNIMSAEPPPISELIPKAPPVLDQILKRAMAKDAATRYPSAVEMSKALVAARQEISPSLDAATITLRSSTLPTTAAPATALRTSQIQGMIADEVSKRQRSSSLRLLTLVGAAGIAALVYFKPWDTAGPTTGADTPQLTVPAPGPTGPTTSTPIDTGSGSAQNVAANSSPPTGGSESRSTGAARGSTEGRQGSGRAATPPPVTQQPPTRDAAADAAAQAAALAATLAPTRSLAQDARRNAQSAGATTAELADGDRAFALAETRVSEGRGADAGTQYAAATRAWNDAAGVARQRAEAARQAAVTPPPRTDTVVRTPPPVTDPRPLIERTIEAYRAAIQAEDIAAIRRVYPDLPAAQQQGWTAFFGLASNLRAVYTITDVTVSGSTATAEFTGTHQYRNASTRRDETQQVGGTISLARDGDAWRITRVAAR